MPHETSSGDSCGEVPETKLAVPASGECELSVGGESDILDEVGVAGEAALSYAVGLVVLGEFSEDDGLVARGCDDSVGAVDWGGDGCDHVGVGTHCAFQHESLSHGLGFRNVGGKKRGFIYSELGFCSVSSSLGLLVRPNVKPNKDICIEISLWITFFF